MKAAVFHKIGDIGLEEVKTPVAGVNDAIVRVKACGICGSDVARVEFAGNYYYPSILGHEFSGEIAELGKKNKNFKIRDRVTVVPVIPCKKCFYCQKKLYFHCKRYNYLGSRNDGGFAEYVKVPIDNLVKIPPEVDYESAALVEPASVCLHSLERAGKIKFGQTVAVFGAGAIGNIIAQWALAYKASRVFIVDIEKYKLDIARKCGLKDVINARDVKVVDEIMSNTNGFGVDVSFEASGSEICLFQTIEATKKLGKIVLVGRKEKDFNFKADVLGLILRKELSISGCWGTTLSWNNCVKAIASGKINLLPLVTHRFKLEQVKEAFDLLINKREPFNKVIFKM